MLHHHLDESLTSFGSEFAVDRRNDLAVEAMIILNVVQGLNNSIEHRRVVDAHDEVRFGAEEELYIARTTLCAAGQALICHPVEVIPIADALTDQRIHLQKVDERLVVVKLGWIVVDGQPDTVLRSKLREGVGGNRALQVQVKFHLGHTPEEGFDVHSGSVLERL